MIKGLALGLLATGLSLGIFSQAWAGVISPDKLKTYAQIYPEVFQTTIQTVAYKPTGDKGQTVALLINSFNGDTDVDELSAVLRPSDVAPTAMKTEAQIKQLIASHGLDWQEYLAITHSVASDTGEYQAFVDDIDKARMQVVLNAKLDDDPNFTRKIASPDHQTIVKKLMESFKK